MAKKRKTSTSSRLTTKAPITAPMLIKAPTAAATAPASEPVVAAPVAAATPVAVVAAETVLPGVKSEIVVDRNAVAQRAFARFVARGGVHGHALEDWLAAEAELRTRALP